VKQVKSTFVVSHPRQRVWLAFRDHLADIARFVNDIESVIAAEREDDPVGSVRLRNVWTAKPVLPPPFNRVIRPEMLTWQDHAVWTPSDFTCRWRVEHPYFSDQVQCSGITTYEEAVGGRGTRIRFEGVLELAPHSTLLRTVSWGVESIAVTLILGNCRKLFEATGAYLNSLPVAAGSAGPV
jgi:hypothetical protein